MIASESCTEDHMKSHKSKMQIPPEPQQNLMNVGVFSPFN